MKKIITILLSLILLSGCTKKHETIKVGIIRVPNDTVVAIENQWIEEEFEKLGLNVEFIFFDSGVAMNQAFASGSLDIAEMGFTNSVVALAKKLPVELFWIHDIIGSSEALVVKDSSIENVEELKGKKIATIFSSTSHLSLLKTLEIHGLKQEDVTLLNMETAEIVAAWNRGDIDTAYTWEPTLSKIKEDGKVLIDSQDLQNKGLMTSNVGLVHKDFAKNNEQALLKFIECLDKAYKLQETDPQKVIKDAASYLEISEELAEKQIKGTTWLSKEMMISDAYMNKDYKAVFHETSKYWAENNFIDKVIEPEAIDAFINTEYIRKVIEND